MKMTGTGNIIRLAPLWIAWIIAMVCFPDQGATAQDFTLEASLSENQVYIGEQFTLQIEIRGNSLRDVELPRLSQPQGTRLLSPTPSRGQSISIVNGVTTTVTTYRFTLLARDAGTWRIPPVQVTIDGEEYQTRELQVEILRQHSLQSESGERRPDIFARIELDVEEPVVGQQVIATLVIYFKSGIEVTSYRPIPGWRTDGFWKEELEDNEQPRAENIVLGNVRYRKANLLQYALFPTRSGELLLDPFELSLGIRTQPTRNDPFGSVFGGLGTNHRRVTLETEEIAVTVHRLDPAPSGESVGAVGDFQIERKASVTQAYTGESIELSTTISGKGNLPLVNKPEYSWPPGFEVYSPREETDLNRTGTFISGSKTFTDRLVPRTAGRFTLPEKRISWFNPRTGRYENQLLPPITFEIIRDQLAMTEEGGGSLPLQVLTGLTIWKDKNSGTSVMKWLFWGGLLLPGIALVIAWQRKRLLTRLEEDSRFARAHHAWDRVEEMILKAEKESAGDSPREAYHLIQKALEGYIADRTGLPRAGLSDEDLIEEVAEKTPDDSLVKELKRILEKCSSISYAPPGSREDVEADVRAAHKLLQQLRSSL